MSEPLSVVVITRDAARQLDLCLDSVSFADEILLVDSGSSDNTKEIASRHGARVIHQDWLGFGPQKNFAVEAAHHNWILSIDADERVSPELRDAIQRELLAPQYRTYHMARRNRFMGRWLRHGEGYPDWSLRLFHRAHARWSDDVVHEKVLTDAPTGVLSGDLLHESQHTVADYLTKQNAYTTLQAQNLYRSGKRATPLRLVASPLLRFVKFYVLRLGFLDGLPGLVHISIGCFNSFMKYSKLAELARRPESAD